MADRFDSTGAFDLGLWTAQRRDDIDRHLGELFAGVWPEPFADALRYPLFTGGKRFRALLAVAAFEALQADADHAPALAAGGAVELVHTYSLVHDDLPCMDDDALRRGQPTVHVAFGEDVAVLVGDALLTEAFAMLAAAPVPAEARVALVAELAAASGARGMVGGQAGDVAAVTVAVDLDTLLRIHRCKTGALITAATVMGGIAGGASQTQLDALRSYGAAAGLAFQLVDDVLDADEDAVEGGPPNFVKLLGLRATRDRAATLVQQAIEAAEKLPQPDALVALARFAINRST